MNSEGLANTKKYFKSPTNARKFGATTKKAFSDLVVGILTSHWGVSGPDQFGIYRFSGQLAAKALVSLTQIDRLSGIPCQ